MLLRSRALLVATAMLALPWAAHAATIWSASDYDLSFSKAAGADFTLAANQDRITSNVWITRGNSQGVYNAQNELSFNVEGDGTVVDRVSPLDTEWAFSTLNGNAAFAYGTGAANYSSLVFSDWETAAQGGSHALPVNLTSNAAVVHLISDDIYLDLHFTQWGSANGGSFAYTRAVDPASTPEPASLAVFGLGGMLLFLRRKA